MRRSLGVPLTLLVFGGAALAMLGYARMLWRGTQWSRVERQYAESLCRPDEKFVETVKRTFGSPRRVYNWYCMDGQGHRRTLHAELDAATPWRQGGVWGPPLAGLAAFVSGLLLISFFVGRERRRKTS